MALLADLPADIRTPFGQSTASMAGALAWIVAEEFDGMAHRLATENTAVAEILRDALPLLPDELRARIEATLTAVEPPDLRVSSFQAVNDGLRALLIEVHVVVEGDAGEAARSIEECIWAELDASTKRRHVQLPGA
jgi:hypothetical protein